MEILCCESLLVRESLLQLLLDFSRVTNSELRYMFSFSLLLSRLA